MLENLGKENDKLKDLDFKHKIWIRDQKVSMTDQKKFLSPVIIGTNPVVELETYRKSPVNLGHVSS